MNDIAPQDDGCQTRDRLLQAAGEVFAEQGFKHATIREICSRAEANVAAVNYHFGDKERLYSAVLRQARDCAENQEVLTALADQSVPADQRLAHYIKTFLQRLADRGRPAWHGKLMSRELVDQTTEIDRFVEEDLRPRGRLLGQLVAELLGRSATPDKIRRSICSIVGQIVFYNHARPVIERMFPEQEFDAAEIDAIAGHVTRFSLAGIEAIK